MKNRIIFCGTPDIAAGILQSLLDIESIEVVAVITQPDRFVGRKKVLTPSPVKIVANENDILVLQPEKIGTITLEVQNLKPDFMVTCAYGQFVPQKILDLFKNCINVHGSLLPKYRGGSPIQYSIMNGDEISGISLMKMIKQMDAGEVYVQEEIKIESSDNSGSLFLKMTSLGQSMIKKYLSKILSGEIKGKPQDESQVTFAYNKVGEQEKIDWSKSNFEIHNFIRAMTPRPIPFTTFNDERWKIGSSKISEKKVDNTVTPGTIVEKNNEGVFVKTGNGVLQILELQRPGKNMTNAGTFKDQTIINKGDKFL
jgi:methionyl-tRNA formyltransferase